MILNNLEEVVNEHLRLHGIPIPLAIVKNNCRLDEF